jgi:ABC-type polysaccharide/polyol phosphate export permease
LTRRRNGATLVPLEPKRAPAEPTATPRARPATSAPSAWGELRALWHARRLLRAFVWNDLKARYVGSSIGFFWTVLVPILELATYTFVFHVLIGVKFHPSQDTGQYVLFLFCGMVSWNAFADGLIRATTSIRDHGHLLRKLNFPAIVLPAHVVLSAVVNQSFRLGILLVGMLLIGDGISPHVLLVPIVVLVQAMLTLGVGLLFATLNVYFRDMAHWVNAGLMLGMFMTPVFYPASEYPRQFVLLLYPNPMAQIIGMYQGLMLNQHMPFLNSMLWATVTPAMALLVGASAFAHARRRFADLV